MPFVQRAGIEPPLPRVPAFRSLRRTLSARHLSRAKEPALSPAKGRSPPQFRRSPRLWLRAIIELTLTAFSGLEPLT